MFSEIGANDMTDKKLTPDELANAVKELIEANGDVLTALSFDTRDGKHEYKTEVIQSFGVPTKAVFIT